MMRIDTIEPIIKECIIKLNTIIEDKSIDNFAATPHDAILFEVLGDLSHIYREIDTCLSEIEARAAMKYENKDEECFCATHQKER